MRNVVIFGASTFGEKVFRSLSERDNITAFSDNDKNKHGSLFCGVRVISPATLSQSDEYDIVIASMYHLDIAAQLFDMGIKRFYLSHEFFLEEEISEIDLRSRTHLIKEPDKLILLIEHFKSSSNTYAIKRMLKYANTRLKCVVPYKDNDGGLGGFYYDLLTAGSIALTHSISDEYKKIKSFHMWHGHSVKSSGYWDKSLTDDKKERDHVMWNQYDRIYVKSAMDKLLLSASYGICGERFEITGYPRNDLLKHSAGRQNLSRILGRSIDEKIIFYAPTFRESERYGNEASAAGLLFLWDDFDTKSFNDFLKENGLLFVIKLHPAESVHCDVRKGFSNIVVLDRDADLGDIHFYELLNGIDLLISDYSSIYFDLLLLDIPIIFTPRDIESIRELRGIRLEPYDFWAPGAKACTFADLKREILHSLKHPDYYSSERALMKSLMHKYTDYGSTKRILESIEHIMLGERQGDNRLK